MRHLLHEEEVAFSFQSAPINKRSRYSLIFRAITFCLLRAQQNLPSICYTPSSLKLKLSLRGIKLHRKKLIYLPMEICPKSQSLEEPNQDLKPRPMTVTSLPSRAPILLHRNCALLIFFGGLGGCIGNIKKRRNRTWAYLICALNVLYTLEVARQHDAPACSWDWDLQCPELWCLAHMPSAICLCSGNDLGLSGTQ